MEQQLRKIWEEQEEKIAQSLAEILGLPYINLNYTFINPETGKIVNLEELKNASAVIFWRDAHKIKIGVIDPKKPETEKLIEELRQKNYQVEIYIISQNSLNKALKDLEEFENRKTLSSYISVLTLNKSLIEKIKNEISSLGDVDKVIKEYDSPNRGYDILEIIFAAVSVLKPSDVHLEPQKDFVVVRFRIDGILHEVSNLSYNSYQILKNRLKLLSGMKLTFKKIAQDGRFSLDLGEKILEVRSSLIPGDYDESFVLRILDPEVAKFPLEKLGFREEDLEIVKRNLLQPNGMILVTGPTGSGKTTTLYSFIHQIASPTIKIITLEDPIEYKIPGIQQTQVNPKSGYTFASGLRAILRQDPDVILVGEIRDEETAQIAITAALTGHLVISTLHTNNSLGAIPRLVNLKVKRDLIPPALRLVIAQRLVRRVCQLCTQFIDPQPSLRERIMKELETIPKEIKSKIPEDFKIPKIVGCKNCNFLGYKGRIGIFEMFEMSLDLEEVILKDPSEQNIWNSLKDKGFVTLLQDGLLKVIFHQTSLEELTRVVGFIL